MERDHLEQQLLAWARANRADEAVGALWRSLCRAVGEDHAALPNTVLRKVRRNGGNTLVNLVRGAGVGYAQVAYDVACRLKPVLRVPSFERGDVASCEGFVLERMGIDAEDLELLRRSFHHQVAGIALEAQVRSVVVNSAVDLAVAAAMEAVGDRASLAAVTQTGRQTVQQTGGKAASAVGRAVARQTARKASAEVARHAVRQVVSRVVAPLNAALWAWTVVDLAGPAYRKTIPAVTYIAMLRRIHQAPGAAAG